MVYLALKSKAIRTFLHTFLQFPIYRHPPAGTWKKIPIQLCSVPLWGQVLGREILAVDVIRVRLLKIFIPPIINTCHIIPDRRDEGHNPILAMRRIDHCSREKEHRKKNPIPSWDGIGPIDQTGVRSQDLIGTIGFDVEKPHVNDT